MAEIVGVAASTDCKRGVFIPDFGDGRTSTVTAKGDATSSADEVFLPDLGGEVKAIGLAAPRGVFPFPLVDFSADITASGVTADFLLEFGAFVFFPVVFGVATFSTDAAVGVFKLAFDVDAGVAAAGDFACGDWEDIFGEGANTSGDFAGVFPFFLAEVGVRLSELKLSPETGVDISLITTADRDRDRIAAFFPDNKSP
jgi:hypothetical protein